VEAERAHTILLTGASGVIGRAVAEGLHDHHVIGLVHSDLDAPDVDTVIRCDLARPCLGLPGEEWHALAEKIDVIVHSAALTAWGQPLERYRSINVEGTRQIVELARLADAPVHFISTCFVHALERRPLETLSDGNVVKPYIWSKWESERLLAAGDVPHTIFRPTNMIGDSRTGASSRPQIVQMMSDWICRGKAPYFPAHPGNRVDVAPLDVLSIAIAHTIETGRTTGDCWVTYGEEAMTVPDAVELLVEHAGSLGRKIEPVPVVDPRRPLPIALEQVPATSRAFLKVLLDVSEVTHACGGVLPSSLPELRELLTMPETSDVEAYRRSLQYWAAERADAGVSDADAIASEAA
jgi:nucleoside-diphosphate-sugar epimerase